MEGLLFSAATGAMGSVLGKLETMLADEHRQIKNIHEDIKFLKDELEAMHAFLVVMADVEEPDEQARLHVGAVREMSYEIEDYIDKFMVLVESEPASKYDGFMTIFSKIMKKIADIKICYKIAKDVKDIKSQVKEIGKRYKRYKVDESSKLRNQKVDPRLCAMFKDTSEFVGIDGPRDELVKWLSNKEGEVEHQPKVLSVVGYGGLGKTTLAKQIYDKLGAKYEYRAFVSISRNPDMTRILSSILSQLRNQDYAHFGEDPQLIINQIRDSLKGRRYFIVIDDIWNIQTWQTLDCALLKNGCGNVIITTTRIHDVAKSCCSSQQDLVYKIRPLSVVDSKRLFFKRTFGCEENCPSNLKGATEGILKKCGGLPLAINAISSLFAAGKTKQDWERVGRSIGFARGKNSEIDAMNYILSLSYFDLPLHLRSCLLYLTMFPEDCEIGRLRLVLLWISEGFIHGEDGKDLIELGETYFHELVNKSLIEPVYIDYHGKVEYCRVHDTVLDFLLYKSTKENFCASLRIPSKPDSRVRRLSLMGNEDEESVKQLDLSHARSLIAFWKANLPSITKMDALRVLDLQDCLKLENYHIKDIGRLFQLRYLNISFTSISELPRQIGDLMYLETLDARQTVLLELPESVTRLRRLVCLFIPQETKFPDGIGNMKKLQELGRINPLKQSLNFVEQLGKLTNLKKLDIRWDRDPTSKSSHGKESLEEQKKLLFFSSLHDLEAHNLATTSIEFYLTKDDEFLTRHAFFPSLASIRDVDILWGKLRWIRKWLLSLVNLEMLTACCGDVVEPQDTEMVGSIPTLLEFNVWRTSPGPVVISSSGGFQRLQDLHFVVRDALVFEAGAMPNLKYLALRIDLCEFISAAAARGDGGGNGGGGGGGFEFGIHHLCSLARLRVQMFCSGVREADVEAAEGALRRMADAHPNHPTLQMERFATHKMLQDHDYYSIANQLD